MIDRDGFRPNVGIILANGGGQVLWAKRVGQEAWQFPQGGIQRGESPEDAMYRELHEEVGLEEGAVRVVSCTRGWLRYRLPKRMLRRNSSQRFVGQKQKWFLLEMLGEDGAVRFDRGDKPEFDFWRWVSYWYPLGQVVSFKRDVYRRALAELAPRLPLAAAGDGASERVQDEGRGSRRGRNRRGRRRDSGGERQPEARGRDEYRERDLEQHREEQTRQCAEERAPGDEDHPAAVVPLTEP